MHCETLQRFVDNYTTLPHTRPLGLDYDGEHQQEHCEDGDTVCVRVTRRCLV